LAAPLVTVSPLGAAQLPLAPSGQSVPVETQSPPVNQTEPVVGFTLVDCLQTAQQRQPRIAAQCASLAAAEDAARALENLHVPGLLAPDLPIRRRQAAFGVTAAAAGVDQARRETACAVTRTYFAILYAREQETVAR